MPHDFKSFLDIYRKQGADAARDTIERWKRNSLVDVTQCALMLSHLERKSGNIEASSEAIQRAISHGGEPAPLNISLAEDLISQGKYAEAIKCCDKVIRDPNDL